MEASLELGNHIVFSIKYLQSHLFMEFGSRQAKTQKAHKDFRQTQVIFFY